MLRSVSNFDFALVIVKTPYPNGCIAESDGEVGDDGRGWSKERDSSFNISMTEDNEC